MTFMYNKTSFTMKKSFFSWLILLVACCFIGCENDLNEETGEGKAKMVLAIDLSVNESSVGYIVPVSEKQINSGTSSLDLAHEVYSAPYVKTYKDWAFYVPSVIAAPTLNRYTRQEDGSLLPSGELTLSQNAGAGVGNVLILSDSKAYATLLYENKIVIFNPTSLKITGEIDVAKTEYGLNGSSTPNPLGMIERDGKVFVGCNQLSSPPLSNDGAYMLIIDETTDTVESFISDARGTGASYFGNQGMFKDEYGDIYILCYASFGYLPTQKSGFLRIKKGQTIFDPDYFFNITDMEISDIEGGHVTLTNFYYDKNGIAYMFGNNPTYASEPYDYVNDKVIQSFEINLYNQKVSLLSLPRSNSLSYSIIKYNDLILFGLTTESNGSGFFSYNPETGEASNSPMLNSPGTLLDAAVFE